MDIIYAAEIPYQFEIVRFVSRDHRSKQVYCMPFLIGRGM